MNQELIIQNTKNFVHQQMIGEGSGHDWWHVERVYKLATTIASYEQADSFVVQLAALLHDIADWKFHGGSDDMGPSVARQFLQSQQVDVTVIDHVCDIIKNLSFKGAHVTTNPITTKEGMVVQDADRLDAIGAIGIARTFAYGGFTHREIYNPLIQPMLHKTADEYKTNKNPTINHFYEKLLLLKDRMNTPTAKKIADKRHSFMQEYLKTFFEEVSI